MPSELVQTLTSNVPAGPAIGVARAVLTLASIPYAAILRTRNALYDRGVLKSHPLGRPTISVGNLSTGGTGKTPVVAYLARHLLAQGRRPAVLLRGYKAVGGLSDEQQELASLLPGVPVIANPDRVSAAAAHLAERPQTDVFLLDDAFQHRRAARDLDLVLVSATQGLSSGRVLPRGMLREPVAGLRRADLLILTRTDQVSAEQLQSLQARLRHIAPNVPQILSTHSPTEVELTAPPTTPPTPPALPASAAEQLQQESVLALAATGDPQAFHQTLLSLGVQIRTVQSYPDHHAYVEADLAALARAARSRGATALATTGKDWVKLAPLVKGFPLPVYVVRIAVQFPPGDQRVLEDLVARKVLQRPAGTS